MAVLEPAGRADAPGIWALRESAAAWLGGRGIRQWLSGEVSLDQIVVGVGDGQWWVVHDSRGLAAAARLLWSDPSIWGDDDGASGYIHGLVIRRDRAGQGLGACALGHLEQMIAGSGRTYARLDCVDDNERLRAYYRDAGYTEVGRKEFTGPWFPCVLLEKPLNGARTGEGASRAPRLSSRFGQFGLDKPDTGQPELTKWGGEQSHPSL